MNRINMNRIIIKFLSLDWESIHQNCNKKGGKLKVLFGFTYLHFLMK
jgi:hypothetical protein